MKTEEIVKLTPEQAEALMPKGDDVHTADLPVLVLDISEVETMMGILPLFRAAAKRAKWPLETVGAVIGASQQDPAALKAMLALYTYQPEAKP